MTTQAAEDIAAAVLFALVSLTIALFGATLAGDPIARVAHIAVSILAAWWSYKLLRRGLLALAPEAKMEEVQS